jgi:hypothetical protein
MVKVEPEPEYDDDCVIVEVDVKPIFCKLEVLDKGPNSSLLSDGLLLEENDLDKGPNSSSLSDGLLLKQNVLDKGPNSSSLSDGLLLEENVFCLLSRSILTMSSPVFI